MSFDETPHLALLSTPPLEEEEDERTTHLVLSFGSSVVLRWNHTNYWKRKEGKGKLKNLLTLKYIIFVK
jgi:hypothetical protein